MTQTAMQGFKEHEKSWKHGHHQNNNNDNLKLTATKEIEIGSLPEKQSKIVVFRQFSKQQKTRKYILIKSGKQHTNKLKLINRKKNDKIIRKRKFWS